MSMQDEKLHVVGKKIWSNLTKFVNEIFSNLFWLISF